MALIGKRIKMNKQKEFNLSERWLMKVQGEELFAKKEIKEFIKRLKEKQYYRKRSHQKADFNIFLLEIDKLVGKLLIE